MIGLIGKKLGQTRVYDTQGNAVCVTVVHAGPNRVVQIKDGEGSDGYNAVQLGYEDQSKPERQTKPLQGHFSKHSYLVKPEIGDVYLFPSQLAHQVYPFRSEGERRSLAFNVHFSLKKQSDQPVKDARSLGVS